MKQREIICDSQGTPDGNDMLVAYWSVQQVSGVEIFVHSDQEFLNEYSELLCYRELRSVASFAVYEIEQCDICLKSFDVIINDRAHLRSYSKSKYKLCRNCGQFHSTLKDTLGIQIEGDIAS